MPALRWIIPYAASAPATVSAGADAALGAAGSATTLDAAAGAALPVPAPPALPVPDPLLVPVPPVEPPAFGLPALREKITGRLRQTATLYEKPPAAPVRGRKAESEAASAPDHAA